MTNPTICTIIAKNYLAAARCLTDSFLEHHPDGQVFVLVIDDPDGFFDPGQEHFSTVRINEIGIKDLKALIHRYTTLELSTAVKPFFLEYLFRRFGRQKLCYFDPDIHFYQPITEIWQLLESYGIVLIPHLLDFLDDELQPSELNILQSGCYNLGFIGLAHHFELDRFLHWWQRKVTKQCVVDFNNGLFVDQRWIDLVPGFFSRVHIHKDPGCNVAYWNLNHRRIEYEDGVYTVNGVPLKFFHFSGFSPEHPEVLSKHQNRFTFENLPTVKPLFEAYGDCLLAHGYATARRWPYTYNYRHSLGVPIPNTAHALWREWEVNNPSWDALDTAAYEQYMTHFLSWLNEPIKTNDPTQPVITRLALAIYQQRQDLQQVYPDVLGRDRRRYNRWFLSRAKNEFGLDDFFVQPLQKQKGWSTRAFHNLGARFYTTSVNWLFELGIGSWLEQRLGERIISPVRNFFLQSDQPVTATTSLPALAPPKVNKAPLGLNVVGYLRDETGVGEAARAALKALHRQGFPVAYTTVSSNAYRKNDHSALHLPEGHPYAVNCFYVNADQAKIVYDEVGPEFFREKYNIGYWHWELSQFPEEWLDRFQYFDEIWVASNFVQNTMAQISPVPVLTIGNHVEKRPEADVTRNQLGLPEDKFLFLFVFDMFSVIERKNPFGVIEAYRRAFGSHSPDTKLVIKVTNLDQFPQHQEPLEQAIKSVAGILIDGYLDRNALNGLFYAVDAYVSLHRSEGFGMTMAEAMSLGKPTIATAYSANTDFMNVTNSYPVGYRLIELKEDYGPYKKGQVWADPDLDHAARQMRRVFENPDEALKVGARAAADIQHLYSSEVIAQKIIRRLNIISSSSDHTGNA